MERAAAGATGGRPMVHERDARRAVRRALCLANGMLVVDALPSSAGSREGTPRHTTAVAKPLG